ncbi:hypothetical protein LINPERPRIM_LOCUS2690 [Linum perenne]
MLHCSSPAFAAAPLLFRAMSHLTLLILVGRCQVELCRTQLRSELSVKWIDLSRLQFLTLLNQATKPGNRFRSDYLAIFTSYFDGECNCWGSYLNIPTFPFMLI